MVEKSVKLEVFNTGDARSFERVVLNNGKFKQIKFPAPAFLIQHPDEGLIVYDTGYSSHFNSKGVRKFPYNLYHLGAPFEFETSNSLVANLEKKELSREDISKIIISHFHADHISGLKDFPFAQISCLKDSYFGVKNLKGFSAVSKAFFPQFLPSDLEERLNFIDEKLLIPLSTDFLPFEYGFDIIDDGSIYGIPLPGHFEGHLGLLFNEEKRGPMFLISDTCWVSEGYKNFTLPSKLTQFVNRDWDSYSKSLKKVHDLYTRNQEILIVPSHCLKTIGGLIENE